MTFQEALIVLNSGRTVQLGDDLYQLDEDGMICVVDDGVYPAELTVGAYTSTEWQAAQAAIPTLAVDVEAYAYKHPEKNRWVSTTNPQKHLDDGHEVAVFVLKQRI